MDGDIPLSDAQVIWDYHGNEPDAPPLIVMGHPGKNRRDRNGLRDERAYYASWGACMAEFIGDTDDGRLFQLFQKFQELVTFEGLNPATVNRAFCSIPEYRYALISRGLGHGIPDDLRDEEEEGPHVARLRGRMHESEQRAIDRNAGQ